MSKNPIDIIVAEAKREEAELFRKRISDGINHHKQKVNEGKIIENMLISPTSTKFIVDTRDIPVDVANFIKFDPHIHATDGCYSIRYIPTTDRRHVRGKPYVIGQDMVRLRVTVSGPEHWHALSSRIPELGWIRRNSTLTDELFGICKKHPGMAFWFTLDFVKYTNKINEKAKNMGIDIDNKPLVAYKCSKKDYEEKYKNKELAPARCWYDFQKEVADSEKDDSVQEEMQKEIHYSIKLKGE